MRNDHNRAVLTAETLTVHDVEDGDPITEAPAASVSFAPCRNADEEIRCGVRIDDELAFVSATTFPHFRAAERYGERVRRAAAQASGKEFYVRAA